MTRGQTNVPAGLTNVVSVSASREYCLALRADGGITAWGAYPALPGGLTNVTAVAAGEYHALALKSDGTIVSWGANQSGEGVVPAGVTGALAVGAGWSYSLALVGTAILASPQALLNPFWSNNVFTVSVQTRTGMTYTLEYKNTLVDSNWTFAAVRSRHQWRGDPDRRRRVEPAAVLSRRQPMTGWGQFLRRIGCLPTSSGFAVTVL